MSLYRFIYNTRAVPPAGHPCVTPATKSAPGTDQKNLEPQGEEVPA